jgi:hypothetical protein
MLAPAFFDHRLRAEPDDLMTRMRRTGSLISKRSGGDTSVRD